MNPADDFDDPEKSLFISKSMVTHYTNVREASAINRLSSTLHEKLLPDMMIRVRTPIELGELVIPNPSIQIVRARPDHYRTRHPTVEDIILIIEIVSGLEGVDSELNEVYQEHLVPQVWTIDVTNSLVDITDNVQLVSTVHDRTEHITIPGTAITFPVHDLIP